MPFDGLTPQPPDDHSLRAPGIVTGWPRPRKGGSGSHAVALSSDGGRVEPGGPERAVRKNGNMATDDRTFIGGGSVSNTFGGRDRLESQTVNSQGVTFKVNAFGQRVSKAFSGTTTHYIHDIRGNIIAEANGSTGTTTTEYIWMEGQLLAQVDGSGNIVYVYSDYVNNPQKIANPSRTLVWDRIQEPFGEDSSTPTNTTPTNHRFPGQYFDAENSLNYNHFRDYDRSIGRYIEPDRIGFSGGLNLFSYAAQNPTQNTDRLGLDWEPPNDRYYSQPNLGPDKPFTPEDAKNWMWIYDQVCDWGIGKGCSAFTRLPVSKVGPYGWIMAGACDGIDMVACNYAEQDLHKRLEQFTKDYQQQNCPTPGSQSYSPGGQSFPPPGFNPQQSFPSSRLEN